VTAPVRGIRLATVARTEQAAAIARRVVSGWLDICGGVRPDDPDAPPERRLATLPVLAEAVAVEGAQVVISGLEGAAGVRGAALWWRLLTPEGAAILSGDIGLRDVDLPLRIEPGTIMLTRLDILPGDVVRVARLVVAVPARAAQA